MAFIVTLKLTSHKEILQTGNKFLVSAILILPVIFAPLSSVHALKWGTGHLEGFSSFSPYLSRQVRPYLTEKFPLLYLELCHW